MSKSGITRRIDELGRIVVPKEIRYNLGIRDGEPLEIYVENNAIIIKKYSHISNIQEVSSNICDLINDACNVEVMISDREKIIASSKSYKDVLGVHLDDIHKKLIDNRESHIGKEKEEMFNIKNYFTILPIITSIDSLGLIFIITNEFSEVNTKYAKIIQKIIVQKLDIAS